MICTFHKNHLEKPTAMSLPIDSTLPMAKQTIEPTNNKVKRGRDLSSKLKKRVWPFWLFSKVFEAHIPKKEPLTSWYMF